MAYADRNQGSSRIVAIVIVALIHAVLGYVLITGLAYNVVKKVAEDLNTFDVKEEPPPPEEEPPPPPPDQPMEPPPVVAPPPIVQTNTPPPVIMQTVRTPPPVFVPTPIAPPAPPPAPPAPPAVSKAAAVRGNPGDWFPLDDYPPDAQRRGEEGTVRVRLSIDTRGRVSDCTVTSSSGSSSLDEKTCQLARRRGRFQPALDAAGNPIASTYNMPGVTWRLEE
ncbi:energy transducer TonB [Sphingomonas gilva]|uniref:Energy transducer TonB n=1 Tax=Sphingomonas gilva TaxID=2305907 RepID=A0A396RNH2_9SPHN|nr:energy transducer TonB [Sphingomonas gilva]RHW17909.1 energy transducer TonB [Sphingomonas gilva]